MNAPQYRGEKVYIQPTYITVIPQWQKGNRHHGSSYFKSLENLKDNQQKGALSKTAQKNIKNSINWLLASAKYKRIWWKEGNCNILFKVNLITLTLPTTEHEISDKDFKSKLLGNWLSYARKYYGLKNYIWKVETQANGNIHAHITSDTFIHYKEIQKSWNRICEANGLIDTFAAKNGHRNPNSTDVHSVKNVKNLGAYLCKYLGKNEEGRRKIKGKLWSSNYNLSAANKLMVELESWQEIFDDKSVLNDNVKVKQIYREDRLTKERRACGAIILIGKDDWTKNIGGWLRKMYDDRRFDIRHDIREFAPPCEN